MKREIKHLCIIADSIEKKGLTKEASDLTRVIERLAQQAQAQTTQFGNVLLPNEATAQSLFQAAQSGDKEAYQLVDNIVSQSGMWSGGNILAAAKVLLDACNRGEEPATTLFAQAVSQWSLHKKDLDPRHYQQRVNNYRQQQPQAPLGTQSYNSPPR